MLDTFTGNTFCLALAPDATFELENNTYRRRSRLTARSGQRLTVTNSQCPTSTVVKGSKLHHDADGSFEDGSQKECSNGKDDSSESTRNLTDDVIHVREDVEIRFDTGVRLSISSSSADDSQQHIIWDGARGQHSWRAN